MNHQSPPPGNDDSSGSPIGVMIAQAEMLGKTCSICQTAIIVGERILHCPDCGLPFHEECWNENQGCSQYGCASAPQTIKNEAGGEMASSVWGEDKACPACGQKIKARAIKCRHCGESFQTRDAISAAEYAQREYADKDYLKARNKVAVLFFLSASGCLSPIAVIMLGMLIFGKKAAGLDYRRLPPALRALAVLGFGLGSLLLVLFVLFGLLD